MSDLKPSQNWGFTVVIEKNQQVIALRRRIKTHMKTKGDHWIETSPTIVLHWWHLLNAAAFKGILQPPKKIHCRNFHDGSWGWCSSLSGMETVEIGIRRELESKKIFLSVLAHEMVHQYQWMSEKRMTHGSSFYAWKPTLKWTLNIHLSEYADDE